MKVKEFIDIAKSIVNKKTLYVMGCFGAPLNDNNKKRYTNNHSFNRKEIRKKMINDASSDTFGFDCVNLIKGILWGWNGDVKKTYGGAIYATNGVPDTNADGFISKCCYDVTTDFSNIDIGEAVWLPGHIGIYIGDNKVIECTPKWDSCVQISTIGTNKGEKSRVWNKHGKIKFIDYTTKVKEKIKKPEINKDEPLSYKVVKGDTLTKIASKFNTTVDKIVEDNKESHSKISRNFICTGWNLYV